LEKILIITQEARSEIQVGAKWESIEGLIPEKGVVIITDDNVKLLYGDRFPRVPTFSVIPGEGSKKLEIIENLAKSLLEHGIDRTGFILAIGGGVVCDIGGFLASIYMRGIRCGYVSTSLLSQVDASTGGKNGVNLGRTKNILGNIRQPEFVICDPTMLLTLSEEEYLSGLSELIKTAIIGSNDLFELIESEHERIMKRDRHLLTTLVARSVNFKASVVTEDEREEGRRRILNFGHTYGHAIEMQMSIKHGFAVATGMEIATEFSFEKGFIDLSLKIRIINLLMKYQLLDDRNIPAENIEHLIQQDKKKIGNEMNFVFIKDIGKAVVEKVPVSEVTEFYTRFRENK
jgi:3-dehydroquinate synthase